MNNKALKSVLDYLEFIMKGNEEYTDEIYGSESISLVPGVLWGIFSIILRMIKENVIDKAETKEAILFIESLMGKYPKVTQAIPLIREAMEKFKSLA